MRQSDGHPLTAFHFADLAVQLLDANERVYAAPVFSRKRGAAADEVLEVVEQIIEAARRYRQEQKPR